MSLILYVGIGILLSLVGLIFYFCIPYIFGATLEPSMIGSAQHIFLLLLLNLLVLFASKVFDAVIIPKSASYSIAPLVYYKSCYNPCNYRYDYDLSIGVERCVSTNHL